MTEYGSIKEVRYVVYGSFLLGDAASGTSVLTVEDAADFDEEGGTLAINGALYAYNSADLDADTITLAANLATTITDGERVDVYPSAVEKQAVVLQSDSDEALTVRVPHNLYDRLPEGMRDEGLGEPVAFSLNDGEWVIEDVLRKDVVIDGSYIDPDTLPPAVVDVSSDGLAPAISPTPTVTGGVGAIFTRWTPVANADPVEYEVHVGLADGFTTSAATLHSVTSGASMVISKYQGAALAYDTNYFVRIVARDIDGPAPASSAGSASLIRVTSDDIATNYVYAGNVQASQITGGTVEADLTVSGVIKTAPSGPRVEISQDGISIFESDTETSTVLTANGDSTFRGMVEADGMTVYGGASFRSAENEISQGGALRLASATTQSKQAPNVLVDWQQTPLLAADGSAWPNPQNLAGVSRVPDGTWIAADQAQAKIVRWNADGTFNSSTALPFVVSSVAQPVSTGSVYALRMSGSTCWLSRVSEVETFADPFNATNGWTNFGTVALTSGKAVVTAGPQTTSGFRRTLSAFRGCGVSIQVFPPSVSAGSVETYSQLTFDVNNSAAIRLSGGILTFEATLGTVKQSTTATYNAAQDIYWRIQDIGLYLEFQTSPDAVTWTTKRSVLHSLSNTSLSAPVWETGLKNTDTGLNLVPNGGFESDLSGWTFPSGVQYERSTARAYSGTASMGYGTSNSVVVPVSDNFAITPNKTYTLSYARLAYGTTNYTTGGDYYIYMDYYAADGTFLNYGVVSQIGGTYQTNTWYPQSGSVVIPATVSGKVPAYARLRLGSGAAGFIAYYWDAISVTENGANATVSASFDNARVYKSANFAMQFTRLNTAQTPLLGAYNSDLQVTEYNPTTKKFRVSTVSTDSLAVTTTWDSAATTGYTGPVRGMVRTVADIATDAYWIADPTLNVVAPFNASTGAALTNYTFEGITTATVGLGWDGVRFYSAGSNGALHKHENTMVWTTESSAWKAGFTWADGSAHETPLSLENAFTMKKRARLTVISPDLPGGASPGLPDRIKVYVTRGAETQHYQATSTSGSTSVTLTSMNWSGTTPPLTTNFSSGIAALIVSTNNELEIKADGTAKVKGLIAYSDQDASTATGNRPALVIGDTASSHLRIDGDEIISMTSDTTQGTLFLNEGGQTQTSKLVIAGTNDATTNSYGSVGYTPPNLIVGVPTAAHLRIDNNEIICIASDNGTTATQGVLVLNSGGTVRVGSGDAIKGFVRGVNTVTANSSGDVTIAHGLSTTPVVAVGTPGTGHQLQLTTIGATNLTFRVRTAAGAVVASGASVEVNWCAFA